MRTKFLVNRKYVLLILFSAALSIHAQNPWPLHVIDSSSIGADGVKRANINNDGRLDIVTGWEEGGVTKLYFQPEKKLVKEKWPVVIVGKTPNVEDAVFADMNNNGKLDVVSCSEGGTNKIFVHWDLAKEVLNTENWEQEVLPASDGLMLWMYAEPLQVDNRNGIDLITAGKNEKAALDWFEAPENTHHQSVSVIDSGSGQSNPVFAFDSVTYFAYNGFGKPLQTIQHPSGEYYKGITYLAYQGPKEDPYVCSYNHRTKEWTGPIKAGTSALGKTPNTKNPDKVDNHGRPALIVDGNGYVHLIFGGHGGDSDQGNNSLGSYGSGKQTHLVSKKPEDISCWEFLDNISPFGTYSQFIKMPNNNIYLFYRHGSHRSDWVYQKSIDNARTFAKPVSILRHKPQKSNPDVYDTWYAWFQEGPDNTVITSFNYHPCANSSVHTSLRTNEYAMKMNTVDDTWENAQGEKLTMPLTKESADSMTMVFDSKREKTRVGTNLADSLGNPHLYFRYNSKSQYVRWTGKQWQTSKINPPEYTFNDGVLFIENRDIIRFFTSYRHQDISKVGWWNSKDNGLTWEKEVPMLSSASATFAMSALIRNAHQDARVIVAEISVKPNEKYSKLYLLGNSGPVKRNHVPKDRIDASQ